MTFFSHSASNQATPIVPLNSANFATWLKLQEKHVQSWIKDHGFKAESGTSLIVPAKDGTIGLVLAGTDALPTIWSLAHLPSLLPAGHYTLRAKWKAHELTNTAIGFGLAQYQFGRYKKQRRKTLVLHVPKATDIDHAQAVIRSTFLVRDLINTPANDMGPEQLALAAKEVARSTGARFSEIVGDDLLKRNYPAIHAVGRANPQAPRLIELNHGKQSHPLIVLVGKGVTFDTGGLDIKPYSSMKLMKKDMGGAALVLGLAQLIIQAKLPIRLRVLIPAVENSIGGNAFRPQDIIQSRKGLSIEVGSTDAEGRLILADALTEADNDNPTLIIDVATLTGAARTALGTELPALYTNREAVADGLLKAARLQHDPLWQLPLWQGYAKYIDSTIADVTNTPTYGFAGSITAALFLERFISPTNPWVHIDSYAWNNENQPGRPAGGEALCLRALFHYLEARFTGSYLAE